MCEGELGRAQGEESPQPTVAASLIEHILGLGPELRALQALFHSRGKRLIVLVLNVNTRTLRQRG